jgi:hypothetical protein
VHTALYERPDVYLMCFENDVPVIIEFIREHYQTDVAAKTVCTSTFSRVVKLVRVEPAK